MKNLKQKIKCALAGLLRDELLEYIGYNHKIPFMSLNDRFMINELPFETMIMEQEIQLSPNLDLHRNNHFDLLEIEIQSAKERFAREVLNHIHVDAQNLTTHEHYMRRSVRFVLRVQSKKY